MYNPHVPPHAAGEAEVHPSAGHPHRSSVERLLATVDSATRTNAHLLPGIRALRLENDVTGTVATGLYCVGLNGSPLRRVRGRVFVLAASAIESARLALLSIPRDSLTAAHGGYLAEHIYAESYLDVSRLKAKGSVNLTIPPASRVRVDRFQLEIRSLGSFRGVDSVLRVVGSAAMDPQPGNRVWLSTDSADSLGVPRAITRLRYSEDDRLRTAAMLATMNEVGVALGGEWIVRPRLRPRGSSYHEAGALRYQAGQGGVTDVAGRLSPYRNVYVGDASVFPCVGVANPILTLTALGYRLGRHLAEALNSGARF